GSEEHQASCSGGTQISKDGSRVLIRIQCFLLLKMLLDTGMPGFQSLNKSGGYLNCEFFQGWNMHYSAHTYVKNLRHRGPSLAINIISTV
ncbi:hypothetical protein Nmel_003803, partial [Mimus melanotis]